MAREGGNYRVFVDGRVQTAVLRGKARRGADRAVAGDQVDFDPATRDQEVLGIDSVAPRKSILARRIPDGRGTRPIAANIDQVVVVIAAANPDPLPQLLDRFLLIAEANEIPAWVIVNKSDLAASLPIEQHLSGTGYQVVTTSTRDSKSIDALRELLVGRTSVFTGPSGVGKSSLLNSLEPELGLRVRDVSAKIGRGQHTTVTAEMIPLAAGGFVVDTPGFSDVGVWEIPCEDLAGCFPEFRRLFGECKYGDCSHRDEPGCAVRAGVDAGAIPRERYRSYRVLWDEIAALPKNWE